MMIVTELQNELVRMSDPAAKSVFLTRFRGIKAPEVRKVSARFFEKIKPLPKAQAFELCEQLMQEKYYEDILVGSDWAYRLKKHYSAEDFPVFERWISRYVQEWATCDEICSHPLGAFLYAFPQYFPQLSNWLADPNPWLRRAAFVAPLYGIRKKQFLNEALQLAALRLKDPEPLVNKACGWLLKESSKKAPQQVYEFLAGHKPQMDKTAFRYAIEKLPEPLRQALLEGK